jgi:hypothetical protein
MGRTAEHYRGEAERCRKLAENTPDRDVRTHLLDVAQQYEKLAEAAKQGVRPSGMLHEPNS